MKQISKFLVIGILMMACSKSSDVAPTPSLVGSWNVTSINKSGCIDPIENGTENLTAPYLKYTFTTTTMTVEIPPVGGITIPPLTVPITVSGNVITAAGGSGTTGGTITFSVSGTTLTLTSQDTADDGGCRTTQTCVKA